MLNPAHHHRTVLLAVDAVFDACRGASRKFTPTSDADRRSGGSGGFTERRSGFGDRDRGGGFGDRDGERRGGFGDRDRDRCDCSSACPALSMGRVVVTCILSVLAAISFVSAPTWQHTGPSCSLALQKGRFQTCRDMVRCRDEVDDGPSRADTSDDWGKNRAPLPAAEPSRGSAFGERRSGGGFSDREGFGSRSAALLRALHLHTRAAAAHSQDLSPAG